MRSVLEIMARRREEADEEEAGGMYVPMRSTSEGLWQGDDPLRHSLPLLLLQICLVVVVTRGLAFALRPLRQPRVIAEIIGGMLLGPSALGRSKMFLDNVFPRESLTVLDTLANIGLLFFLFLVGLELDPASLKRTGRSALAIAVAGISLPFSLGVGSSLVLRDAVAPDAPRGPFIVFMGVALSITAFPVLARILAELKLLTTELGRMAMSAAAVNDVTAWILLALAIALSGSGSPLASVYVLLSGAAFVAAAVLLVRPVLAYMARRSPDGEPVKESFVCAAMTIVLAAGLATDTIGIHALFGAFVIGVLMPKEGAFAGALTEKIEDLVSSLLLPLYFVSSGLKTDVGTISGAKSWGLLLLVITTACVGKIGGTVLTSLLMRVPVREAVALGLMMNTKGLVELIVLNIGRDRKVLNEEAFAILVLMALVTTFLTTPAVTAVYRPAHRQACHTRRTVERGEADADSELRVLACFHGSRGIPTLINLVEASRGTRRSKLTMYAMHLVELSERPSAISMVQRARRNGLPFSGRGGEVVVQVAFEAFQRLSAVKVKPMTAISDLATIHEDIVASAAHKRAALIVLPFHKMLCHDGTALEPLDRAYHHVNVRVLRRAPCSVAVLVDRALGGTAQVSAPEVSYAVLLLFFGGPDDREALAYASRMAEHPGIALTVARFTAAAAAAPGDDGHGKPAAAEVVAMDEEAMRRHVAAGRVRYEEVAAEGRQEVAAAIKEMGRGKNLVVTGRSGRAAPALVEKSDCPELGPVGSYLATQEFSATASVLVVQRHDPRSDPTCGSGSPLGEEEALEDAVARAPMPSPAYTPTRPPPQPAPMPSPASPAC